MHSDQTRDGAVVLVPQYSQSFILLNWSGRWELNPQRLAWKASALPIELLPRCCTGLGQQTFHRQ